jgi:hypothetical protein
MARHESPSGPAFADSISQPAETALSQRLLAGLAGLKLKERMIETEAKRRKHYIGLVITKDGCDPPIHKVTASY